MGSKATKLTIGLTLTITTVALCLWLGSDPSDAACLSVHRGHCWPSHKEARRPALVPVPAPRPDFDPYLLIRSDFSALYRAQSEQIPLTTDLEAIADDLRKPPSGTATFGDQRSGGESQRLPLQ